MSREISSLLERAVAPHLEKVPGTFDLPGVEVFAVGQWNGENYSREDLAGIVEAFKPTLEEIHPWVTINHTDPDALKVALGGVAALYLNSQPGRDYGPGERLFADLVNLPRELALAVAHRNFQRPSIELRIDYESVKTGEKYPLVLQAVSFEGAKLEAVRVLDDLLKLYGASELPKTLTGCDTLHLRVAQVDHQLGGHTMANGPEPEGVTKHQEGMDAGVAEDSGLDAKILEALKEILSLLKAAPAPEMEASSDDEKKALTEKDAETLGAVSDDADETKPKKKQFAEGGATFEQRLAAVEDENSKLKNALTRQAAEKVAERRLSKARLFVEQNSSEKCFKIPTSQREKAVFLLTHAPSVARKFSEGNKQLSYAEALKGFIEALPDHAGKFRQATKDLPASSASATGSSMEAIKKMAEEKVAAGQSDDYLEAFDDVFNKLSAEEQLRLVHPEWIK